MNTIPGTVIARAALEVLDGLEGYVRDTGVERIADLIGAAQPRPAKEESQ